jgi:hypothetical protein
MSDPSPSPGHHAFEQAAEDAYDDMYRQRRPKEAFEDAMQAFTQAIATALAAGQTDEAERLKARRDHVRAVYDSQFRWVT